MSDGAFSDVMARFNVSETVFLSGVRYITSRLA